MNQMPNMEMLSQVSKVLARELPETVGDELPLDVADILIQAKTNMRSLPAVIKNLEASNRDFSTLELAINRLRELAAEAAMLPEMDQAGRDEREKEFVKLAGVVAQVAGRTGYSGPELSLKTRGGAQAAHRILRYLGPVKDTLSKNLTETSQLVLLAIKETVDFLDTVARAYPEAAEEYGISHILPRVSWISQALPAEMSSVMIPTGGLH